MLGERPHVGLRLVCCVGISAGLRATEAKPCLARMAYWKLGLPQCTQVFVFLFPHVLPSLSG